MLNADLQGNRSPKLSNSDSAVGLSLSNGQVGYISYATSEQSIQLAQPQSLEAWTVAWSNMEDEANSWLCLYSGGDDSVFCKNGDAQGCSDRNEGGSMLQLPLKPLGRDLKTHEAGVTAILPLNLREEDREWVVLTGSYDEHIRVLTLSDGSRRSKLLAEKRLHGGGVWRLKLMHFLLDHEGETTIEVLASCMHAGVRVLRIFRSLDDVWSISVVAKFTEHESMNYASDVRDSMPDEESGMIVVSSSFYDRKLCVWKVAKT